MDPVTDSPDARPDTLRTVGEITALARIIPRLPRGEHTVLGPGDDAAVVGPGWTRGADGWHPPDHDEQQPPPPTDAERIARLEADNAALQDAVEKLILDQLLGGMP